MRGFSPALLLGTQLFLGCTVLVENELDKKSSADAGSSRDAGERDAGSSESDAGTGLEDGGEPSNDDDSGNPPDGPSENEGARLSFGRAHVCAMTKDGRVACWGDNSERQIEIPDGTYIEISTGFDHTCVIKTDGSLLCKGKNSSMQSVSAPGPYRRVAAGDLHTCALTVEGRAQCFSKDNFSGLLDVPGDVFSAIAAGPDFTCGIRESDSALRCWGNSASSYQSAAQGMAFSAISASEGVVCGIQLSGEPVCFGARYQLDVTEAAVGITAASYAACVLLDQGEFTCGGPSGADVNGRFSDEFRRGPYVAIAASREFGSENGALCAIPRQGPPECDSPRAPSLLLVPTDLLP